jgi:DNA-binding transcriptional LysR family regulator
MDFELDARLRAFAALARRRSFSAAAEELFVSQPAISRHIGDLEKQLGMPLVIRQQKGCTLTPAGEYLAIMVLKTEAILSEAARGLKAYKDVGYGTIVIAASGTPGNYLLPPVIASFHLAYPNVEIIVFMGTSGEAVDAVRSHKAEICVVGGLASAHELHVETLTSDKIVLIGPVSMGNRAFEGRDLQGLTWISREEGSATRRVMQSAWDDLGIKPKAWVELPSWEAVKLAVAHGAGVAACSRFALDVELQAGTLVILDVPLWHMQRHISIVALADILLTPPAERFVEMLRQRYKGK